MGRPRKVDETLDPNATMVTWLGAEDRTMEVTVWNGVTFRKGEAVPLTDPVMIETAKGNPFYSVDE